MTIPKPKDRIATTLLPPKNLDTIQNIVTQEALRAAHEWHIKNRNGEDAALSLVLAEREAAARLATMRIARQLSMGESCGFLLNDTATEFGTLPNSHKLMHQIRSYLKDGWQYEPARGMARLGDCINNQWLTKVWIDTTASPPKPLTTRERETLLTIIGLILRDSQTADIQPHKLGAALEVLGQRLGVGVSEDTIAAKIKEALGLVPPRQK